MAKIINEVSKDLFVLAHENIEAQFETTDARPHQRPYLRVGNVIKIVNPGIQRDEKKLTISSKTHIFQVMLVLFPNFHLVRFNHLLTDKDLLSIFLLSTC